MLCTSGEIFGIWLMIYINTYLQNNTSNMAFSFKNTLKILTRTQSQSYVTVCKLTEPTNFDTAAALNNADSEWIWPL